MLILFRPDFVLNEPIQNGDNVTNILVINQMQDQENLNIKILKFLRQLFPNPNNNIKRLKDTIYYTITTLPNETNENVDDWLDTYIHKLITYDNTRFPIPDGFKNIIFNTFYMADEENYSDEDLYSSERYRAWLMESPNPLSGYKLDNLMLNESEYTGTNFSGSSLKNASFYGSTLVCANFTDTNLSGADFTEADLRFADFSVANTDSSGKIKSFKGANAKFANFVGADLSGADLSFADFRHTNLAGTNLLGCNLNSTKLYGANMDETIYGDEIMNADGNVYQDDIEYTEFINLQQQRVDENMDENMDELVDDNYENELEQKANKLQESSGLIIEEINSHILQPLEIDPMEKINNSNYTYEDVVNLLTPKINSEKIPISKMEVNKWYGIASLGLTDPVIWSQNNIQGEPHVGTVFKCIIIPFSKKGEAIVYETVPACMSVHELSKQLDISNIFKVFLNIIGETNFNNNFDMIINDEQNKRDLFAMILYNFILYTLSDHNSDETINSWTRIFDDVKTRRMFVKHAIFNKEEGIMYHPRFDDSLQNGYPENLLCIKMFIDILPEQIKLAWAQNYILEFITGYGQSLETFDPNVRSEMGFIASCLNGNLEKLLLSIRTAIIQFYPTKIEEETEEDKLLVLKNAVTGSEFQKYFATVEDINGPTIEGYKNYIKTNTNLNEKQKEKYLLLLEDPIIISKLNETISVMSGGKKIKHKKTNKNKKLNKKNLNKKTIKKLNKKYNKKTIKKFRKFCSQNKTTKNLKTKKNKN